MINSRNMMNVTSFFQQAEPYLQAFRAWVSQYSPQAQADHICFKCVDATEFEEIRRMFESESVFIYQSIVSKRRIALIKFNPPLETGLGAVSLLELSDQKPDNSQTSGFDHIEIYPLHGTMEEFVADLELKGAMFNKIIRPHHTTFDATILDEFKIRIEPEALMAKVKEEEII